MKKFDGLKALGILATLGTLAVSLLSGFVSDKKIDAMIDKKIQDKLADK